MSVKSFCRSVLLLFTALGLPSVTRADAIIGNLGGQFSGYYLGQAGSGLNNSIATGFTMTSDFLLTDAQLVLQTHDGKLGLSLYSDNGNKPGSLLLTFTSPAFQNNSVVPATYTFTPTVPFTLVTGQTYWLDLYSTATTTSQYDFWSQAYQSGTVKPTGSGATFVDNQRNLSGNPPNGFSMGNSYVEFQLNGTPVTTVVPEPSSIALLGLGGVGLGFGAFHRRRVAA